MKTVSNLRSLLSVGLALFVPLSTALAAPSVPENLGSGLRPLVETAQRPLSSLAARVPVADEITPNPFGRAILDDEGAVLVNVVLNGRIPLAQAAATLGAGVIKVTGTDATYHQGVIEGYVDLADVVALAKAPGVQAVHLVHRPVQRVGATTSQGFVQHRVDRVRGLDGTGVKVGVLSDSFNTSTSTIKAANDIASGDLPGPGNRLGHLTPVQVIEDSPGGTDEGRAMLQIVHDLAPGARLAFATANGGEVGFANNIRALANAGCDVIVDDVGYFAEPMFSDGIVARAVDEVTARGKAYFSSAGNDPATVGYRGVLKINGAGSAPGRTIPGTNCVLPAASVLDPTTYAGGFHNFAATGTDNALSVAITTSSTLDFQWDDPYDVTPVTLGGVLATARGSVTASAPAATVSFAGTAGQRIAITANADASRGNPIADLVITLLDPAGHVVAVADNTTVPEQLVTFLTVSGNYTIRITGFNNARGDFTLQVNSASGSVGVTSDFNILVFSANGQFITAATENNIATGRPLEILGVTGNGTIQVVFARANTPPSSPTPASVLRCLFFDSGRLLEHFSYSTPTTFGHNCAAGANGVAAYAFFAPFIPESFTSPGPVTIFFDNNNHRLATPVIRQKPDLAALDGANTTFFGSDVAQDSDTFPNFFGTSAAAPHAAAIAALVLQAHGGPGSVTPTQMRTVLQRSAFLHDLDPGAAAGTATAGASRISLAARGDGTATSQVDTDSIRISLTGPGRLASITLTLGDLVFDTRTAGGAGFPFTLGTLVNLTAGNITPTFQSQTSTRGVFRALNLRFSAGSFAGGDSMGFGVDRDDAVTRSGGGSASLLGLGVQIPSGAVTGNASTFSGNLEDGTTFSGTFANQIGAGYSPLDGFGFINAEAAVSLPLP